jgi:hypothetical protein
MPHKNASLAIARASLVDSDALGCAAAGGTNAKEVAEEAAAIASEWIVSLRVMFIGRPSSSVAPLVLGDVIQLSVVKTGTNGAERRNIAKKPINGLLS